MELRRHPSILLGGDRRSAGFLGALLLVAVIVPLLNRAVPSTSALHLSSYALTLIGGMSLGIVNKLLEPYAGAVLGKIGVLVALILFIQRRPRGLFPQTGRAAESQ